MVHNKWSAFFVASALVLLSGVGQAAQPEVIDYGICGGEPLYPVIGVNFATACGPRNQVALGRRGALSWSFPPSAGQENGARGTLQLNDEQLARISVMAEVAQITDPVTDASGAVNYKMGINFTGRQYKRVHAVLTERYAPSHEVLRIMLSMVPDTPALPECPQGRAHFDPTKAPDERAALTTDPHRTIVD